MVRLVSSLLLAVLGFWAVANAEIHPPRARTTTAEVAAALSHTIMVEK